LVANGRKEKKRKEKETPPRGDVSLIFPPSSFLFPPSKTGTTVAILFRQEPEHG
jgi:hypothetical protein